MVLPFFSFVAFWGFHPFSILCTKVTHPRLSCVRFQFGLLPTLKEMISCIVICCDLRLGNTLQKRNDKRTCSNQLVILGAQGWIKINSNFRESSTRNSNQSICCRVGLPFLLWIQPVSKPYRMHTGYEEVEREIDYRNTIASPKQTTVSLSEQFKCHPRFVWHFYLKHKKI